MMTIIIMMMTMMTIMMMIIMKMMMLCDDYSYLELHDDVVEPVVSSASDESADMLPP